MGQRKTRLRIAGCRMSAIAAVALVLSLAGAGVALAAAEHLKMQMPKVVTSGRFFKVTVKGFTPKRELLALFLDSQRCASTGRAEGHHSRAAELDFFVTGSFKKSHRGKSTGAGKHYLCGYLQDPVTLQTFLHKGRAFQVG